ncbi:hypothetical protein MTO96_018732 [Rhipicephalus appendiculatus]
MQGSKEFSLFVIDNESYEKDAVLYIELGEPKLEEDLLREHGVEEVPEVELTEAQKIALMGRPRLGDQCRCTIRIKESKEFKNTVDKLFQKANVSLMIGTSSWKEQFIEAITVVADEDRNKFHSEEAFRNGKRQLEIHQRSPPRLSWFSLRDGADMHQGTPV